MSKEKKYILKEDGSFLIKNYNQTHPFSNFLPGIAGVWGVPSWVFYVNRNQAIVSFGIQDKDHCILEFFPANKSYWLVSSCGFRTFLRINHHLYYEPFRNDKNIEQWMVIKSSFLEIKEINYKLGLQFCVKYFTLPNFSVGALIRILKIKNISIKKVNLEILDGLQRIVPFGSRNLFLKDLSRTLEAWMHSFIYPKYVLFRLTVDPQDSSDTKYIEGASFNCAFYEDNNKTKFPLFIADPEVVFGKDTSYSFPQGFFDKDFKRKIPQITCGKTPSSFGFFMWDLEPNKEKVFYSVFGASFYKNLIQDLIFKMNSQFIKKKEEENEEIVERIKNNAFCVSGKKEFNHYIRCSYLDNILRGGYPYTIKNNKKNKIYYVFSRKHGDLERDYNKFKLLPSYFSEGEANYRDINQNRRIDLFFNPFIKERNIVYFLNFIKIDGYNPLVVKGGKLIIKEKDILQILKKINFLDKDLILLMKEGFYLGEFFNLLERKGKKIENKDDLASILLDKATFEPQADFGEGYWIDHWRYSLDLIENFLYFYPDKIKDLFLKEEFFFWDDEIRVKERKFRYFLKEEKVYQGKSIEKVPFKEELIKKRKRFKNFLRTKKGKVYRTNLVEKLLAIILNKFASLDPYGIGVEMEAEKPGWCDSLNGLPSLFGSSLCETLELKRACLLLLNGLKVIKKERVKEIVVCKEVFYFFSKIHSLLKNYFLKPSKERDYFWWNESNFTKEEFRKDTFFFLCGEERKIKIEKLEEFLEKSINKLDKGIEKARDKKEGFYFTYFTYQVEKYEIKKNYIFPQKFKLHCLPMFLEAFVHLLRVEKEKEVYYALKKSPLYDKKLKMYRLNASLKNEPLEIGRSRVFISGWLENESIWLHMEYKYLLEVLKCGLYEEFFNDFYNCGICFLDPGDYGRSILENSSFIVSSAYPDKNLWKKGFVARLTGATVELLNIWILLCLGKQPFFIDKEGKLCIKFSPILKKEFFTTHKEEIVFKGKEIILDKDCFAFKLFSSILVIYHNPKQKDTFKNCKIKTIVLEKDREKHIINSSIIPSPFSYLIRKKRIDRIDIYLD